MEIRDSRLFGLALKVEATSQLKSFIKHRKFLKMVVLVSLGEKLKDDAQSMQKNVHAFIANYGMNTLLKTQSCLRI